MENNNLDEKNIIEGTGFVLYQTPAEPDTVYGPQGKVKKEKKRRKRLEGFKKTLARTAIIALVFGLVSGAAFSGVTYWMGQSTGGISGANIIMNTAAPLASAGTDETEGTVKAVTKSCMPSVVSITNKSVTEIRTFFGNFAKENQSSGSGVIIGQNDSELLIVTNYHVISGSQQLSVVFSFEENQSDVGSDRVVSAVVKGYDASKDLAVISVNLADLSKETKEQVRVAVLGESNDLELGEHVVAIGNALGYGQSVTDGIISALNRGLSLSNSDGTVVTNKYIQTNAAINPGNSGGALLNMRGELIGINSAKVSDSSVEGMGYAIPISDVLPIITDIMSRETRTIVVDEALRGYLGISGEDVTSSDSQRYGMPIGVYVSHVTAGSAADKAGINQGNIITKLDGYTISSMAELQNRLKYYAAGETVDVVIHVLTGSGYQEQTISVTLCTGKAAGIE